MDQNASPKRRLGFVNASDDNIGRHHVTTRRPRGPRNSEVVIHRLDSFQDEIPLPQEGVDTSSPPQARQAKRARNDVTRSSMSYPRRRAVRACQLCRTRKTKCNNFRPVCGACSQINATCIYDDNSDHSS